MKSAFEGMKSSFALEHPDTGDLYSGTRMCRECLERKPITQFQFTAGKHYRIRKCNTCNNKQQLIDRAVRPGHKNLMRWWSILNKYGITEEEFWQILLVQEGRCAICRLSLPQDISFIHIDHSHHTDKIRGLLHPKCNQGLGYFNDSPEHLRLAATYLEAASK